MTAPRHELALATQCGLLNLARSSLYYVPREESPEDLALLTRMDEMYLKFPYWGTRNFAYALSEDGRPVGRKRARRLMRVLNIESLAPKPNLSKPDKQHKIYPYLLRDVVVERAGEVWATDITYIPLENGYCYLVAVIDWFSRKILSWRLSNTLDASFCVDALKAALREFGKPEIFNTDQGCQFTSEEFTGVLLEAGVQISMDGKGRCLDNVFVERLWRSLKYENVYLNRYSFLPEAKVGIGAYFILFNGERPHQSLGMQTPNDVFRASMRSTRKFAA